MVIAKNIMEFILNGKLKELQEYFSKKKSISRKKLVEMYNFAMENNHTQIASWIKSNLENKLKRTKKNKCPAGKNIEEKVRQSIPKPLRDITWQKYFTTLYAVCPCCGKNTISVFDNDMSHIVSCANGGQTIENNLIPLCKSCNRSMGAENMDTYMKKYFQKDLTEVIRTLVENVKTEKNNMSLQIDNTCEIPTYNPIIMVGDNYEMIENNRDDNTAFKEVAIHVEANNVVKRAPMSRSKKILMGTIGGGGAAMGIFLIIILIVGVYVVIKLRG